MLSAHRNALDTFHRDQKASSHGGQEGMVQFVEETSDLGPFEKMEDQIATAVVGATLLFGCEVRVFRNNGEKSVNRCGHGWFSGITRQKRGHLEKFKKTLADLWIS